MLPLPELPLLMVLGRLGQPGGGDATKEECALMSSQPLLPSFHPLSRSFPPPLLPPGTWGAL